MIIGVLVNIRHGTQACQEQTLRPSKIDSFDFGSFQGNNSFKIVNDQKYNLFSIVRFGILIMTRKGNGTVNLRRPKNESRLLIETEGAKVYNRHICRNDIRSICY